ncbi:hypothetical protein P692DRAFT_20822192 [Suillus brevipes Sb2]|nr:hypothetical protein P692DRAFT_20822192 [Suillus brevipes Sb2]
MAMIKSSFSWIIAPSTKSRPNPAQTYNCKRKTHNVNDIREPDWQSLRLTTEISGICFKAPVCLAGRDVDMYVLNGGDVQDFHEEDDKDKEESDLAVNQRAAKIYKQFFVDIIEEAPNQRSRRDGSYLSIPTECVLSWHVRRCCRPSFNQVQYCVYEAALAAQHQNFKKCTYFCLYVALAEKIKLKSLHRTRHTL